MSDSQGIQRNDQANDWPMLIACNGCGSLFTSMQQFQAHKRSTSHDTGYSKLELLQCGRLEELDKVVFLLKVVS